MTPRISVCLITAAFASSCLWADFSYEQTTKMTGGVMKSVAFLSKQLREPIRSSVSVKGDRMAMMNAQSGSIIDLASETITEINFQKQTYSVLTFAQMKEALDAMQAKMKGRKGGDVQMTVKPSVKETGQTKVIEGLNARELILTIEMEGTNPETNQTGTMMTMVADMWMAPDVPGYGEVRSFYERMAQKLAWVPGQSNMMAGQGSGKGWAEMMKEMSKLQGIPVLQVTKMNMGGAMPQGDQAAAGAQQQAEQQQQQQQQTQVEPEKPSISGALGKLGGRFGGFGRKKKTETDQQQSTSSSGSQAQSAGGAPSMMEMTTELAGFSSAPVDASKFSVPPGFKQVDSEMLKMSRGR